MLAKGGIRKSQAHSTFMPIGYTIDHYKYSFYTRTITQWSKQSKC